MYVDSRSTGNEKRVGFLCRRFLRRAGTAGRGCHGDAIEPLLGSSDLLFERAIARLW